MDKVRFGVISCSGMAQGHVTAIVHNRQAQLIAVRDIDEQGMKDCAELFGVDGYLDYREMIRRDDIDAVIICTPDQLHREMTEECLKAGKHILCEKPMALTLDDCKPTEVMAYSNKKMLKDWPTDDCTISIMKFPNDVIGKMFVSTGCKRNYTMRSCFYGSKSTIITDNTIPHMQVFKVDADCSYTTPMLYPIKINNHNTIGEVGEFVDCIVNDKPIATTVYEGAATVAAALAAVRSAKSGMPEKIDYNFDD